MTVEVADLVAILCMRIAETAIEEDPFPHIVVDDLLPATIYSEILIEVPARAAGNGAAWPSGGLGALHTALSSNEVARYLLEKFRSHPLAIPPDKSRYFTNGATELRTLLDLGVDRPGYAVARYMGSPSEIVSFYYYLSGDHSLAQHGLQLCIPDDPRVYKGRTQTDRSIGMALSSLPNSNPFFRRFERSKVGVRLGVGEAARWLPREWFKVGKLAENLPNRMVAFAANDRSYYAEDSPVPRHLNVQQRHVLRGSIVADIDDTGDGRLAMA